VKEHFFVGMGLQGELTKPSTMADNNISYIFVSITAVFSLGGILRVVRNFSFSRDLLAAWN
jgi:hypothetical protein